MFLRPTIYQSPFHPPRPLSRSSRLFPENVLIKS
jgi:hypothetical protein